MKSVVLLSGGIDSATALAHELDEENEVEAISFDYGQKHNLEIFAAQAIADHYKVENFLVTLPHGLFAAGALSGDEPMPHMTYQEIRQADGPSPTYVPFRNGSMLALATAHALTVGAHRLVIGAHAEDARNWAYPDCTPDFMRAMGEAIRFGSYYQVSLHVPWQAMTKFQIIEKGLGMGVPYKKTWSCYDPIWTFSAAHGSESHPIACGQCPTCVSRLEAFKVLGVEDPAEYAVKGAAT